MLTGAAMQLLPWQWSDLCFQIRRRCESIQRGSRIRPRSSSCFLGVLATNSRGWNIVSSRKTSKFVLRGGLSRDCWLLEEFSCQSMSVFSRKNIIRCLMRSPKSTLLYSAKLDQGAFEGNGCLEKGEDFEVHTATRVIFL